MNREEIKKIVWDIANNLRDVIYTHNLAFSAARLLFLKYAVDNNIGVSNMDDMKICSRAQKMFAMRDTESGIDTIFSVLQYIDKAYGLENVLTNASQDYARELLGIDSAKSKRSATPEGFKRLLNILGQCDFEESKDSNEVGRFLVDCLIDMINSTAEGKGPTGMSITRSTLSDLVKVLLNVTSDDTFCDYASGAGLSTLAITRDVLPSVSSVEIDPNLAALSAMLYILYGYKDFQVINGDGISRVIPGLHGSKIFVDGPIGIKLEQSPGALYKDVSLEIINKGIHHYLDRNGRAIITVPSNVLFNASKPVQGLREELVELGVIKAVIALPPLWLGTAIGTNLLVIEKGNGPIHNPVFINAMDSVKVSGRYTTKTNVELPKDLIAKISATVERPETIDGFSYVATEPEIAKKEFNLTPANYVAMLHEEDSVTLEEIDAKLDELYAELKRL